MDRVRRKHVETNIDTFSQLVQCCPRLDNPAVLSQTASFYLSLPKEQGDASIALQFCIHNPGWKYAWSENVTAMNLSESD